MSNILISDAGSTKTDWSLLNVETGSIVRIKTKGINPLQQSDIEVLSILSDLEEKLDGRQIDKVFYFGAGCVGVDQNIFLRDLISKRLAIKNIVIESDIIGAGKALFGDGSGLACILGTGSNTCLFINGKIQDQIPSLGYILGDEGSGSALGKCLVNAIFKKQLPDPIINLFQDKFNLNVSDLIEKVYRGSMPAQYLASYSSFLSENFIIPEIKSLVYKEFEAFFIKNVLPYKLSTDISLGFIGSIAYTFQDCIREIGKKYNSNISVFVKTPMPYLENYFIQKEWTEKI